MKTFKDGKGRSFNLEISIGSAKRAKGFGVDLIDGDPAEIARKLHFDAMMRYELLWHFCTNKEETTQEDFEELLVANVLKEATDSLIDEVEFFIQSLRPEIAEAIPVMMKKLKEVTKAQIQTYEEIANSPEMKNATDKEWEKIKTNAITELSSSLQASSELTQTQ